MLAPRSDSAVVTSRRRRGRSRASTWIHTKKVPSWDGCPRNVDDTFTALAQHADIGAVRPVHRHPAAHGDETDDVIAWHGRAAPGNAGQQVIHTLDDDALYGAVAGRLIRHRQQVVFRDLRVDNPFDPNAPPNWR